MNTYLTLVVLWVTMALAFTLWCLLEERATLVQAARAGAALMAVPKYFIPCHCPQCIGLFPQGILKMFI